MLAYLDDSQADMQSMAFNLVGVIAQALILDKSGNGQNHLASEILDCRDTKVVNAIISSVSGEDSGQKLKTLEDEILQGNPAKHAMPLLASVKKLVTDNKVDPTTASYALTSLAEKAAVLSLHGSEKTTQT
jgi:hypothetical protein